MRRHFTKESIARKEALLIKQQSWSQMTAIQFELVQANENSSGRKLGCLACEGRVGSTGTRMASEAPSPRTWAVLASPSSLPSASVLPASCFLTTFCVLGEHVRVSYFTACTSRRRLVFSSQFWFEKLRNDSTWPVLCWWIALEQFMWITGFNS